jgi:hypothetical protein
MTDACTMRGGQRIGDLDRMTQCLVHGQWASSEASRQGFALEVLHHQESDAVVAAHIEDGADVRMAQCGEDAGLAVEALPPRRVGRQRRRYDLDRNGPFQAGVAALVDLAHPAGAQRLNDFVRPESSSAGQRHFRRGPCSTTSTRLHPPRGSRPLAWFVDGTHGGRARSANTPKDSRR